MKKAKKSVAGCNYLSKEIAIGGDMSKRHNHPKVNRQVQKKKALHKDWRTWLAIGIMLGAIGIYIFTLDDSVELSAVNQSQTPVAATTPSP